jgi:hypothetical protein
MSDMSSPEREKIVTHAVKMGVALCESVMIFDRRFPPGHAGVVYTSIPMITCEECRERALEAVGQEAGP